MKRRNTLSSNGDLLISVRVVAVYLVVSALWIACSDVLVTWLVHSPERVAQISIAKGLFFISVTSALLYILIRRAVRIIRRSENTLAAVMNSLPQAVFWKDVNGTYRGCNPAFAKYVGLSSSDAVIGKTDYDLPGTSNEADAYRADDRQVLDQLAPKLHIVERVLRANGESRWVDTAKVPLFDERHELLGVLGIFEDITERKQVEERARTSLQEKEVLLRELYHRTKNNMQVICALLELQTRYSGDTSSGQVLREMADRIKTMALVHQKLYQSGNLSRINLRDYIAELVELLRCSHGAFGRSIEFSLDLEPVLATIDSAIPCGLILNELLSNTLKYAFAGREAGLVRICLSRQDGVITVSVSDNGRGFDAGFDPLTAGRLGLTTVKTIARHQLRGDLRFESRGGVTCTVTFPDPAPHTEEWYESQNQSIDSRG